MPTLGKLYQQSMLKHPYGYALYEPESSKVLQPGYCGYFTELGQWTPLLGIDQKIISLGDSLSLTQNGLTRFEHFHPAPSDERSWGPKLSGHVIQRKIDLETSASALIPSGIPVDIGALYRYSNDDGFGAILMTETPVIKDLVYGTTTFRLWCKENSETILRKWPDVREYGLVIVTSTYRTRLAMLNAWAQKGKEISVGFRGGVVGIGEIAPSSTWYTSHEEAGWVSTEATEPGESKVVFCGGLYFKYRRLAAILPQSRALKQEPVEKVKFRDVDPEEKNFRIFDHDSCDDGVYETFVTSEELGEMINLPANEEGTDGDDDF
ncbi:hypothetical protein N7507_007296 [Penicillium longicatenatum]|nr:hypothetical protein N7507_007296 [Penicillium longicatenatum]